MKQCPDSLIENLSKSSHNLQKLQLECGSCNLYNRVINRQNHNNQWTFDNCLALSYQYDHPQTVDKIYYNSMFCNLQCLELTDTYSYSRLNDHDAFRVNACYDNQTLRQYMDKPINECYDNMNQILAYLSHSLLCLKLEYRP